MSLRTREEMAVAKAKGRLKGTQPKLSKTKRSQTLTIYTRTTAVRADNSHHIRQAAERRHELTRSKAVAALRELEKQGGAVTFEAVAAATVSRSWLYTQPDLRAVIIGLRDEGRPRQPRTSRSSANTESLRARLQASLKETASSPWKSNTFSH